ncbi:MAG: hypothetical protein ACFFC6_13580, partial [Promethearchaeota archaeon]
MKDRVLIWIVLLIVTFTLTGNNLVFDSLDIPDDVTKKTFKSISQTNSPDDIVGQIVNSPIYLINKPNLIIADNIIGNFTNSTHPCGIWLINCPNTQIYNNTITNITSTSNTASAIHIVNSENTTIWNNTIEMITSTSSVIGYPRDIYGIRINNSMETAISDVKISQLKSSYGNGYGISIESSQTSKINDSEIDDINSKSSHGIRVYNSPFTIVEDNIITNIFSSTLTSFG